MNRDGSLYKSSQSKPEKGSAVDACRQVYGITHPRVDADHTKRGESLYRVSQSKRKRAAQSTHVEQLTVQDQERRWTASVRSVERSRVIEAYSGAI